jgi:hypothetical protein
VQRTRPGPFGAHLHDAQSRGGGHDVRRFAGRHPNVPNVMRRAQGCQVGAVCGPGGAGGASWPSYRRLGYRLDRIETNDSEAAAEIVRCMIWIFP